MIWKVLDRVKGKDKGPDYEDDQEAASAIEAVRTFVKENKLEGKFYAEAHCLNDDGIDECWPYTDDML